MIKFKRVDDFTVNAHILLYSVKIDLLHGYLVFTNQNGSSSIDIIRDMILSSPINWRA